MKIVAIIPARMAATRFPGKPLTPILGLPMIEHVRRRVSMCDALDEVIVATCDETIKNVVEASDGKVVLTSDRHERCTDRISEAAAKVNADIVINVQGDEPLVMPEMMDEVTRPLLEDSDLLSVNLVTRIVDPEEFNDPNVCKVVTNRIGDLLYISREPIPSSKMSSTDNYIKLKQLGISPISTMGFGFNSVCSFSRVPKPPQRITTFIRAPSLSIASPQFFVKLSAMSSGTWRARFPPPLKLTNVYPILFS